MAELKELRFGTSLLEPTIAGEKKITIRKYRAGAHDFQKGEIVKGAFKDGLNVLLQITADTETKLLSELTDTEAQEDDFHDAQDAFDGLKSYYPDLQKTDTAAMIRYEVLKVQGVPVVSFNEEV